MYIISFGGWTKDEAKSAEYGGPYYTGSLVYCDMEANPERDDPRFQYGHESFESGKNRGPSRCQSGPCRAQFLYGNSTWAYQNGKSDTYVNETDYCDMEANPEKDDPRFLYGFIL